MSDITSTMNIQQLIVILKYRWRLLLAGIGILVAMALVYSLLAPNSYTAKVSLVINGGDVNAVTGVQGFQQFVPTQATFVSTQSDIISSHIVALSVVDTLHLDKNEDFVRLFKSADLNGVSLRDWIADRLLKHSVLVEKSTDSNVVIITTKSSSPVMAAALANAFATGYIKTSVKIKADAARRQAQWMDEQVNQERNNLRTKQSLLTEYQRAADVTDAQTNNNAVDIETARLNDLSSQLALAQAARSDVDSRYSQMRQAQERGDAAELADVSNSLVIQSIKTDLNHAEANLAQINERFGTQHPKYLTAAAEVQKIKSRLNAEISTVLGGISQAAQQADRREAAIRNAMNSQQARILSFKQKNDQRDVLSRDVEEAKLAYESALKRSSQVNMESRLDQSGIVVLSAATVPALPSSPNLQRNVALSLLLGVLLLPGFVLLMELKNRRIHSAVDLDGYNLLVLGEIPRLTAHNSYRKRRRSRVLIELRPRARLSNSLQKASS